MYSPVIIFIYNKPDHTRKTIGTLFKNHLASETEVYISSDAAKDEKAIEKVKLVRKYTDSLPERNFFKSVKITKVE